MSISEPITLLWICPVNLILHLAKIASFFALIAVSWSPSWENGVRGSVLVDFCCHKFNIKMVEVSGKTNRFARLSMHCSSWINSCYIKASSWLSLGELCKWRSSCTRMAETHPGWIWVGRLKAACCLPGIAWCVSQLRKLSMQQDWWQFFPTSPFQAHLYHFYCLVLSCQSIPSLLFCITEAYGVPVLLLSSSAATALCAGLKDADRSTCTFSIFPIGVLLQLSSLFRSSFVLRIVHNTSNTQTAKQWLDAVLGEEYKEDKALEFSKNPGHFACNFGFWSIYV